MSTVDQPNETVVLIGDPDNPLHQSIFAALSKAAAMTDEELFAAMTPRQEES